MPTYERVQGGRVVERVQPLAGDYEDTRLGLLALEGEQGWRLADDVTRPAPEQSAGTEPAEQQNDAPPSPAEHRTRKSKE
ncbi:hypothetical protein [Actinophytocola sediminis]